MTENTNNHVQSDNPFDTGNFSTGGGVWGGKKVTITGSKVVAEPLAFKDGTPVLKTDKEGKPIPGTQQIQIGWKLTGIAEGQEKERSEVYSSGDQLVPTSDGEGFQWAEPERHKRPDGTIEPVKFHASSNIAKLAAALAASGFATTGLFTDNDPKKPMKVSRLVGAEIVFMGEVKKGRDGKPLKDGKGYDKMLFLPERFVGFVATTGNSAQGNAAGNGGANTSELDRKAEGVVISLLAKGPKTRAELIRQVSADKTLAQSESNAIVGLIVQDAWHKGRPWAYDGTVAKLSAEA